ncbi:hypothetical protein [Streptomyces antibioticus]|uniref:hypothetical protein n=1 Tax=Streptomyces antibioticus TaxID=1890 RepID=UPI003D742DC4
MSGPWVETIRPDQSPLSTGARAAGSALGADRAHALEADVTAGGEGGDDHDVRLARPVAGS